MSMLHEEFRLEETPLQILQIIIANTANQYCRNYICLSYMKKFRLEETPNVANIAGITDIANIANQYCRNYKCLSYMMKFRLEETPLQILQMFQISQLIKLHEDSDWKKPHCKYCREIIANITNQHCRSYKCLSYIKKLRL